VGEGLLRIAIAQGALFNPQFLGFD